MGNKEKQLELAKEAVSLIKEFKKLESIVGDNAFNSVKAEIIKDSVQVDPNIYLK